MADRGSAGPRAVLIPLVRQVQCAFDQDPGHTTPAQILRSSEFNFAADAPTPPIVGFSVRPPTCSGSRFSRTLMTRGAINTYSDPRLPFGPTGGKPGYGVEILRRSVLTLPAA